ncbi:MAG: hypothetical protein GF392_02055 [Candidatus Omnitrophica bacterium]|nr:hypothetical protein [Candidatus Omnitrophota bacterium]
MAKKNVKKRDFMKEMDNLVKKYQPAVKRTGEQLSKALKVAEEDISKMYKMSQLHIEAQMKNMEREKLYYDLGKDVAPKLLNGELEGMGLDKHKKHLEKIYARGEKLKKAIVRQGKKKGKPSKKRTVKKKTAKKQK